jgi:hypothetical protein
LEPPGYGQGGTNGWMSNYTAPAYTSDDLWLEIKPFTKRTAALVIHPPWNDTNISHDLFCTTNLSPPIDWHFTMRCVYTNAVVPGLCDDRGFFRLGPATNGSLTVTTNVTADEMAQMLVPSWVMVSNATYTGALDARGIFAGGNGCGLLIESGVLLSSGTITNAIGPNDDDGLQAYTNGSSIMQADGDADLNDLTGRGPTKDAAVLEFDMVSLSNSIAFDYVLASEEYAQWISTYNDPMAIFVTSNHIGTNWLCDTNANIALVPGTELSVTVSHINGGSYLNLPANPQYYVDNHDPVGASAPPWATLGPAFNVQFNGMTVLLTARKEISPGVVYHVKIGIEDYQDDQYDSAVFIRAAGSPCRCR